jgi:hypothetical protein
MRYSLQVRIDLLLVVEFDCSVLRVLFDFKMILLKECCDDTLLGQIGGEDLVYAPQDDDPRR